MEASEKRHIPLEDGAPRSGQYGIGDRNAIAALIADDRRSAGVARLDLMVNTVLDRLTASDGLAPGTDAGR